MGELRAPRQADILYSAFNLSGHNIFIRETLDVRLIETLSSKDVTCAIISEVSRVN